MNKPIWEEREPNPWCRCTDVVVREYADRGLNYWCRKCQNWFVQPVPYCELLK